MKEINGGRKLLKPRCKRVMNKESKVGLKKVVNMQKTTINKLGCEFEQLKFANRELQKEVLKYMNIINDLNEAHMFAECDWMKEKAHFEKQIALLKGKILIFEDERERLLDRTIWERITRKGERT